MNPFQILALCMAMGLCSLSCKQSTVPLPPGDVEITSTTQQQSPLGAHVYSKNGVTTAQLGQVEAGLTQAFNDGRASGWADNGIAYDYSRYIIYIPVQPCKPSPGDNVPSFTVRADNYDGSIWDQYNPGGELPQAEQTAWKKYYTDGFGVVFAAEYVRTFNTPGSTINGQPSYYASFVVCPDASVLKNGTDYGAEHAIVAHYDLEYAALTNTHVTIGHPILPKRALKGIGKKIPSGKSVVDPVK